MISTVIRAHPKRREWADQLAVTLDATVVWDRHNDEVETGLRCLQAYDPAASHHLIVEDDAVVCRDLVAGVERAVDVAGDRIVGLYIGAGRPLSRFRLNQLARGADQAAASWIRWPGTLWGVALAVPTVHIGRLTAQYRRDPLPRYDGRLENCARRLRVGWQYTWPSLVDHRDAPGNPPLAQPDHPDAHKPGRVAYRFLGADRSALDVDWHAGVYDAGTR